MLKFTTKSRKIISIILVVVIFIVVNLIFNAFLKNEIKTNIIILIGLIAIFISYLLFTNVDKKLFSLFTLFLLSFIVFQFGEPITYLLRIPFEYRMFNFTNEFIVNETIVYTINSIILLILGATISKKSKVTSKKTFINYKSDNINGNGKKIFYVLYIIFFIISLYSLYLSYTKGYLFKREFEDSLPPIILFLEPILVALAVIIILTDKNQFQKKKITVLMIIWSLIVAANGDRTKGISGILLFGVIWFFVVKTKETKNNKKELLKLALFGVLVLVLISGIMYFRTIEYRDDFKFSIKLIFEPIFEMGYNFNSLSMTKEVMGKVPQFKNGSTYIKGVLASFPQSLDFFNIIKPLREGLFLDEWLTNSMGYDFGTGFSLVAESYLNFGNKGFYIFIIIGLLISSLLQVDLSNEENIFKNFQGLILLFLIFTAPRRQFYNIASGIFYTYIVFPMIIYILSKIKHIKVVFKHENLEQINESTEEL